MKNGYASGNDITAKNSAESRLINLGEVSLRQAFDAMPDINWQPILEDF